LEPLFFASITKAAWLGFRFARLRRAMAGVKVPSTDRGVSWMPLLQGQMLTLMTLLAPPIPSGGAFSFQ
jgi:hypothetical protein